MDMQEKNYINIDDQNIQKYIYNRECFAKKKGIIFNFKEEYNFYRKLISKYLNICRQLDRGKIQFEGLRDQLNAINFIAGHDRFREGPLVIKHWYIFTNKKVISDIIQKWDFNKVLYCSCYEFWRDNIDDFLKNPTLNQKAIDILIKQIKQNLTQGNSEMLISKLILESNITFDNYFVDHYKDDYVVLKLLFNLISSNRLSKNCVWFVEYKIFHFENSDRILQGNILNEKDKEYAFLHILEGKTIEFYKILALECKKGEPTETILNTIYRFQLNEQWEIFSILLDRDLINGDYICKYNRNFIYGTKSYEALCKIKQHTEDLSNISMILNRAEKLGFITPRENDREYNRERKKRNAKQSNGCYIATAIYGSYDCPKVWTLRRFRDNVLDETWFGRLFIAAYYATSPRLVRWFGETKWFKSILRKPLDKLVAILSSKGFRNTPYHDKY